MKIRMAYAKKDSAQYIAHLDMARLFQRAFRRAAVEIVYSEGFNPHPKISFGAPLPVGMAGEREYVDVDVRELGFDDMREGFVRLSAQMPLGIELLAWQILPDRAQKLMALLDTAVYRAEVPGREENKAEAQVAGEISELERGLHRWLEQEVICWDRKKEGKVLSVDIRPFIRSVTMVGAGRLNEDEGGRGVDFEIVTVLGNAGSVRPMEILGAFCRDEGLGLDLERARARRTGVYWLDAQGVRRAPDEI
jgi:radical SAM-linked protein